MTALVSVVIATHNRPYLLADTVRSALEQDGPVEIVVVDDGPTGSARPVIAALSDPRVRYFTNPQPSTGRPAAVRNYGATQTTGPLLHFLDDDDRVPPGFYAAARAALTARRRAGLVYGMIEPFGDDPAVIATERAYFHRAHRPGRSRLCTRELQFLGADTNVTELRGMTARPGRENECAQALMDHLDNERVADFVQWHGLPPGLQRPGFHPSGTVTDFVLTLEPAWDALRARLPRNVKQSLRKGHNSLARDGHAFRTDVLEGAACGHRRAHRHLRPAAGAGVPRRVRATVRHCAPVCARHRRGPCRDAAWLPL